jgi:hypothetical protein
MIHMRRISVASVGFSDDACGRVIKTNLIAWDTKYNGVLRLERGSRSAGWLGCV